MIFFNKKYFIADMLEGLTDMHCHVLPAIDDGAKDNDMSLEMVKQYTEMGYSGIIATPHIMEGFYDNTLERIIDNFKNFKILLQEQGYKDFYVNAAAEYMMDGGFDYLTDRKEFLPIIGNKVLIEMSFLPSTFRAFEQIFQLQQQGFDPILAHPERYSYLGTIDEVLAFKKKGCHLQLNILSLGGHYGKQAAKQAILLLKNGHFDYLGTDAHRPRHFNALKQISISKNMVFHLETLVSRTKENLFA